jgi:hypothetical protein
MPQLALDLLISYNIEGIHSSANPCYPWTIATLDRTKLHDMLCPFFENWDEISIYLGLDLLHPFVSHILSNKSPGALCVHMGWGKGLWGHKEGGDGFMILDCWLYLMFFLPMDLSTCYRSVAFCSLSHLSFVYIVSSSTPLPPRFDHGCLPLDGASE